MVNTKTSAFPFRNPQKSFHRGLDECLSGSIRELAKYRIPAGTLHMCGNTACPLSSTHGITFSMAYHLTAFGRLGAIVNRVFNVQMSAFAFLSAAVPQLPFDSQLFRSPQLSKPRSKPR